MIRKAKVRDVLTVQSLINQYAQQNLMLGRSLSELYENIRDFWVFVDPENHKVVGCCALHVCWKKLAEIKSLAVAPKFSSKGIGSALVLKSMDEAKSLGIKDIFVLTFVPKFFRRFGFRQINKNRLPHKIWVECCNCPKFPDCNEIALIKKI
jgi:amino-acid N-acetyltransferase